MWNLYRTLWNPCGICGILWNPCGICGGNCGGFHPIWIPEEYSMEFPYGMNIETYTKMAGLSAKQIPYGIHRIHMELASIPPGIRLECEGTVPVYIFWENCISKYTGLINKGCFHSGSLSFIIKVYYLNYDIKSWYWRLMHISGLLEYLFSIKKMYDLSSYSGPFLFIIKNNISSSFCRSLLCMIKINILISYPESLLSCDNSILISYPESLLLCDRDQYFDSLSWIFALCDKDQCFDSLFWIFAFYNKDQCSAYQISIYFNHLYVQNKMYLLI